MKLKILNTLKFFIGWPISALALFFIVKIVAEHKSLIFNFNHINKELLLLAIISFFPYFLLRVALWQRILKEKNIAISFKDTAYMWESAEIKRFVPGFIWPFLSRALLFSKNAGGKKNVAYSIFIEIEAFLIGCFLVSLFAIPFIYEKTPIGQSLKMSLILLFFVITLLSVLIFVFARNFIKIIIRFENFRIFKHPLFRIFAKSLPDFSPVKNLVILILSTSSLFFFGLGTYLTISSFTLLSPVLILEFIGFFVLSLLLGYLSFLTPMGLGVREAVIIYGLSTVAPLAVSSIAAVYSRVVLIFSEIIFFAFTFFWRNTKHKFVVKVEDFVSSHKQEVITGIGIIVYILYFTNVSFLRFDNFYTGRFDLGNMDQTVWNSIHGRVFQLTDPNGIKIISRLAFHADFILVLISPLYKIWADPRMLLLLQSVVLAAGAIFIFKLANMILRNKNAALVFSLAFLLNPSLQYVNLYDFHPVALATTLLLATFYFFIKKKYFLFLLFAILAGITKEQVWVVISFFGLYFAIFQVIKLIKKKTSSLKKTYLDIILGIVIFLTSIFIFYYLIIHAIPTAAKGEHFALSYYSDFGDSPINILKNVVLSPGKIIQIIQTNGRLNYLLELFLPLGFLPILSPLLIVFASPDLVLNLLSNNSNLHQIYYQYTSTITPFLFIGAIFGASNLIKWFPKRPVLNLLLIYVAITTLCSAYLFGPLPGAKNPNLDMITKQVEDRQLIQAFISGIPQRYKVAATNNLGSHLSRRRNLYTIPVGIDNADVILFLLNDPFAQPSLLAQKKMAQNLAKKPGYKLLFKEGDFVVIQKTNINYNRLFFRRSR